MEDFGSMWTFHESVEELKYKLQYVTYELEMTRKITNEEIMKNNENVKKLLQLLQVTCKERDEAKSKLKKLQHILAFNYNNNINNNLNNNNNNDNINNNIKLLNNIDQIIVPTTPFSPDTPLLTTGNNNNNNHSSLVKSNDNNIKNKSNCNNNNNNNSSSFEIIEESGPTSSNICFGGTGSTATMMTCTSRETTTKVVDQSTLVIEGLAKGRPRPRQGKLLQAVLEAGPLLQTLLVAGSLPRWRNPPGQLAHQQVPLVSQSNKELVNGSSNYRFYGGYCPDSMLDFGKRMMPSNVSFDCLTPKRQRIL